MFNSLKRKLLALLLSVYLILSIAMTTFASENIIIVDDELAINSPKESEIIKIGYLENWGIVQADSSQGGGGYGYEYFEELSKYTHHKYEYVKLEMDQAYQMLEDGEIDIFGPIGTTDYRKKIFEYSSTPFLYGDALLLALEGSEIGLGDIDAIENKSVSVLDNSTYLRQYLDEYLDRNYIEVEHKSYEGLNGLEKGNYELELVWNLHVEDSRQIVDNLGTAPLYFVTKKGNAKLLEEINAATEQLTDNDEFFKERLSKKYFKTTTAVISTLTLADELLLEEKENSFTVLMSPDHEPYQYIDKNGNPAGIIIDIMDMISMDAGIEFNYVYETQATVVNYEDVDISITLLNSPFGDLAYTKTDSILELPMMFVVNKSENIEKIRTVGMLDYYNFNAEVPVALRFDSFEEMIVLIKKEEIDAIVSSDIYTTYLLERLGVKNYSAYPASSSIHTRMLLSDQIIEYEEIFNKLISRLDHKKIETIVVEHCSHFAPEESVLDYLIKKPIYIITIIFVTILSGLAIFIIMSRNKKKYLFELINKDNLTGLLSSYKFNKLAGEILRTAKPYEYMLVSIDVDSFKYLNEAYGYEKGSEVLVALSKQISLLYDTDSIISRERADNFLILTSKRPTSQFVKSRDGFDDCVSTSIQKVLGAGCKTSISRGIYEINNPMEKLTYMIDCANTARCLGKETYGNSSHLFTAEMQQHKKTINKIVNAMECALKNREFVVFYQPKVELKECNLMGAEALIRWFPDDGSTVYPDSFIPLYEKNGFIVELDYFVFEEVCSFIFKWKDTLELPVISVNLSVITMLDADLVSKLSSIANKYMLDTTRLELEITESAIVKDFDEIILKIKLLKEKGFSISLDDFGSGLSSLNRLKDINVDVLKIDREFLSANLSNEKGIAIIKNIIKMSKEINILTIAEGVETKEQVEFLQKLECDYAQGYYFGKPMKEKDFIEVVANGIQKT